MQKIVCEVCGSNQIEKIDDRFICQHCGTRYSIDEARKLIGSVSIDRTSELQNLYILARRAKDNDDSENASKYYDMILQENPDSWEALFYQQYFTAMKCRIIDIESAALSIQNILGSVLELMEKHISPNEYKNMVGEIVNRIVVLGTMMHSSATNHFIKYNSGTAVDNQELINRITAVEQLYYVLGILIEEQFHDNQEVCFLSTIVWDCGIRERISILDRLSPESKVKSKPLIDKFVGRIRKYNSDYQAPPYSTGGCYIATSIYGTYDCPAVWTLRRFRDNILNNSYLGRLFIRIYYFSSPKLIRAFCHTRWFCTFWRLILDRIVTKLNNSGCSGNPYSDI